MQGLTAGDSISLSGMNAHKDSDTIISVIFQTKEYKIEQYQLLSESLVHSAISTGTISLRGGGNFST